MLRAPNEYGGSTLGKASVRRSAFPPYRSLVILRKEVIQPQVLLRLPCYDLVPIIELTFGGFLPCGLDHRLRVLPTLRGLTGGVYKAQEHIHRGVLIRDY